MIFFNPADHKPVLPHHVTFYIVVVYTMKSLTQNIFCTVLDEGASTCIISLECWKAINQPKLSPSPTFLIVLVNRSFRSHDIIPSFPMQLEGKTMCIEVEVVDVPLEYNILLGRSWTYAMKIVVSTIF
jgi:hypothetical protein